MPQIQLPIFPVSSTAITPELLVQAQAQAQAAARARAVAASTNTSIHIMKDGKIVEIFPAKEVRYPTSSEFQEGPELSVVREDTPLQGDEDEVRQD